MGLKESRSALNLRLGFMKQIAIAFKASQKSVVKYNDKYNPLREYILRTEGQEIGFITSVNTRAAARNIKREYQQDKGVKVSIIQYIYSSDRYDGGMIISAKEVR